MTDWSMMVLGMMMRMMVMSRGSGSGVMRVGMVRFKWRRWWIWMLAVGWIGEWWQVMRFTAATIATTTAAATVRIARVMWVIAMVMCMGVRMTTVMSMIGTTAATATSTGTKVTCMRVMSMGRVRMIGTRGSRIVWHHERR